MLKIGIIGSGFGLYGLLPAFNAVKSCRVTCICGKKTERLLNYCRSIKLENIYTDWRQMLEQENLDALAIAVTPNAQYEIAKAAIKKNLNIFAEKPFTANYRQAKELLKLAQKKRIVHTIDYTFPEIEEWQKVKQLIDKKTYGKLRHISVNWNFLSYDIRKGISGWKTDVREGGGALSFYFSHSLYYLEHYAGEVVNLRSLLSYSPESKNGGEVGVNLLLKFKNGATGDAAIRCNDKHLYRHQLIFICEKATVVLESKQGVFENFTINIYNGKEQKQLFVKKSKVSARNEDERVRVEKKFAARFVNGCINKKSVKPTFAEGLRVQKLTEEIRKQAI